MLPSRHGLSESQLRVFVIHLACLLFPLRKFIYNYWTRWALIKFFLPLGWALIGGGRLLEVGAYSRLGTYLNKYGYPLDNDLLNNCEAAA